MTAIKSHPPGNYGVVDSSARPMDLKPNEQLRDNPGSSEDSVAIVVMGGTGAGKSTFVSLLTDQEVKIGHDLKSCTTEVGVYSFHYNNRQTVHIIDTPGFDDTNRPDSEILQEIALFLAALYANNVRLAGLIYLHRITDTRVSGSSLKNLNIFQKLCGEKAFPYVILATTMWSALDAAENGDETGRQRCNQLQRPEFWGDMLQKGSTMKKHDGSKESAYAIVSELVKKEAHVVLEIQTEMKDQNLTLDETGAGLYLQKNFREARERYEKDLAEYQESIEQALAEKDAEAVDVITKEREAAESRMAKLQHDNARLHLSLGQLAAQRATHFHSRLPNVEAPSATVRDTSLEPRVKDLERRFSQIEQRQSTSRDPQNSRTNAAQQLAAGKDMQERSRKKKRSASQNKQRAPQEHHAHSTEETWNGWNILTLLEYLWKDVFGFGEDRDDHSRRRQHAR
ncbi:P-loop containing nucleoside triphosphate hydrolase protein [Trichoderma sp. SZMC 28012]